MLKFSYKVITTLENLHNAFLLYNSFKIDREISRRDENILCYYWKFFHPVHVFTGHIIYQLQIYAVTSFYKKSFIDCAIIDKNNKI